MHRFRLHKITNGTKKSKIYALMNGVYFGGNDVQCKSSGIVCDPMSCNGKAFRLIVSDDGVMLSTSPKVSIQLNGETQTTSVTNSVLKVGDRVGIGCDVFELVQYNPADDSQTVHLSKQYPCHHEDDPVSRLKSLNRIDCPRPNCNFACWCIADLNQHVRSDAGHQGTPSMSGPSICVEY